MSKYVMIICKNCGEIQLLTEEYYNKHKKSRCQCVCGNGWLNVGMREILKSLKCDFEIRGLYEFQESQLFDTYKNTIKKTFDKGFEILKVEDRRNY